MLCGSACDHFWRIFHVHLEEWVFCWFWMECPVNIKSIWCDMSFRVCVSLLIFCLDDLSIDESGVVKSSTVTVSLSISPLMAVSISLTLMWFYVGCIYIYNCCIFLDWSVDRYVVSSFVFCSSLYFKACLSDRSIASLVFCWFLFAWNTFSISSLSVCMCP